MFAVLFGGAVAMLPAFIHDVFHYGPEGLGILRAAPAVGAIATGIYLARHPLNRHAGKWLLAAVAGFGVCIILFALTSHFWIAAFLLMLSGICDGVSVVMRSTIMQLMTPHTMRGRVSAINGIFIGSSNELGVFCPANGIGSFGDLWRGNVPGHCRRNSPARAPAAKIGPAAVALDMWQMCETACSYRMGYATGTCI